MEVESLESGFERPRIDLIPGSNNDSSFLHGDINDKFRRIVIGVHLGLNSQ